MLGRELVRGVDRLVEARHDPGLGLRAEHGHGRGERRARGDQQGGAVGPVLELGAEVGRAEPGIGGLVGDDHHLARARPGDRCRRARRRAASQPSPSGCRGRRSCPRARRSRCRRRARRSPARRRSRRPRPRPARARRPASPARAGASRPRCAAPRRPAPARRPSRATTGTRPARPARRSRPSRAGRTAARPRSRHRG